MGSPIGRAQSQLRKELKPLQSDDSGTRWLGHRPHVTEQAMVDVIQPVLQAAHAKLKTLRLRV